MYMHHESARSPLGRPPIVGYRHFLKRTGGISIQPSLSDALAPQYLSSWDQTYLAVPAVHLESE